MKALDTNALVRFLVRDDEQQALAVKKILLDAEKKGDFLFIPFAVTLETIWVLSSVYDYSKKEIIQVFESLLLLPILMFDEYDSIADLCRIALKSDSDPDDLLIGLTARNKGCAITLTFDKKAAQSELFTLI
jgi:predicted nucleic-acid-binding protein